MDQQVALNVGDVDPVGDPKRIKGLDSSDVGRVVESQEQIERWLPRGMLILFVGVPLAIDIVRNGTITFSALFTAGIVFVLVKLVNRGLRSLVLTRLRAARYDRAAARLKARVAALPNLTMGPFTWTLYAPGSFGALADGTLVALVRAHGYQPLTIAASCIADVRVRSDRQMVTSTVHSGRSMIGAGSSSVGLGHMLGGSSSSVSREVGEYFLEIRYQLAHNGPVECLVIPGGGSDRVVEDLCAAIRRLEA